MITEGKQTAPKEITVKFSSAVSVDDVLTLSKNSADVPVEVTFTSDFTGAVLTATDKLTTTTYTVTLDPAAEGVESSTFDVECEIAKLAEIEFLNDVLVMKDHDYNVGYAYFKGYDQYHKPVTLSGIQVTAGMGTFKHYDHDTGRLTLEVLEDDPLNPGAKQLADDHPYLFMKNSKVPVFVQAQVGNDIITGHADLQVSDQAYVSNIEFAEELGKDGGEKREDKRLTVSELSSNKYYVQLDVVEDQYGNTLDADDLNAMMDKDNRTQTLFVIPNGENGAFYTTGKFGMKDDKVILWLEAPAGDGAKKGAMDLTITGAGGYSATKTIEVEDDPMISTLSIDYPELFAGHSKSNPMTFSGVIDNYGDDMDDLWNVRPYAGVKGTNNILNQVKSKTLTFTDENSLTQRSTTISMTGGAVFNLVSYDVAKKEFEVTIDASGCKPKDIVVFTTQTADMQVFNHTITIGEEGGAAKVKGGASVQLHDAAMSGTNSFDFNSKAVFEDVNGKTMNRLADEKYPAFMKLSDVKPRLEEGSPRADLIEKYYWTLSADKKAIATADDGDANDDGKITTADVKGPLGKNVYRDYYVTILGQVKAGTTGYSAAKLYILDDETWHFNTVQGEDKNFTASASGLMYANPDEKEHGKASVSVSATTTKGETYSVAGDRIKITTGEDFPSDGSSASFQGNIKYPEGDKGTVQAIVAVDDNVVDAVELSYDTVKPYAKSGSFGYKATAMGNNGDEKSLTGTDVSGSVTDTELTASSNTPSVITVKDGTMEITYANKLQDTYSIGVKDQYGVDMTTTEFYMDGKKIASGAIKVNERHEFQYKNGAVSGKFYMTFPKGATIRTISTGVPTATSLGQLTALLANDAIGAIAIDKAITNAGSATPLSITKPITIKDGGSLTTQVGDSIKADITVEDGGTLVTTGVTTVEGAITAKSGSTLDISDVTRVKKNITVIDEDGTETTFTGPTGAVVLDGGNITLDGETMTIADSITQADPKADGDAVILKRRAVLDVTGAGKTIGRLTIDESCTLDRFAVIDVNAQTLTVPYLDGSGHAFVDGSAGGKLNDTTTGQWAVTGNSIDIAAGVEITLIETEAPVLNIGSNQGTITVMTAAALESVLENITSNGEVKIGTNIALSKDIENTSANGVKLYAANNVTGGKIVNEGKLEVTGSGTLEVVVTNGSTTKNDSASGLTLKTDGEGGTATVVASDGTVYEVSDESAETLISAGSETQLENSDNTVDTTNPKYIADGDGNIMDETSVITLGTNLSSVAVTSLYVYTEADTAWANQEDDVALAARADNDESAAEMKSGSRVHISTDAKGKITIQAGDPRATGMTGTTFKGSFTFAGCEFIVNITCEGTAD